MWRYIINHPKPSKSNYEFKVIHSFEKRKEEGNKIRNKYPDKIPVILEKADNSDIPDIDNHKFLLPRELTIGQFLYFIRKHINLSSKQALYLFVNNSVIPNSSDKLEDVYKKYADKDNFLYITYATENTFG